MEQATWKAWWRGEWKPLWRSPVYSASLVVVAGLVVLLPLLYLAVIAAVGYGVYWHATEHTAWATGVHSGGAGYRSARAGLAVVVFGYIGPLFAGGVLFLFLIKPLVALPSDRYEKPSIYPSEEPELFAYVGLVCRTLGAPTPKRIDVDCDVNASASFRRGLWSVFVPGDMVLTIGMPLVTGLTLAQFTGVLAHEFAHFNQGFGMRANMVIGTILEWFQRRAYLRDAWDDRLEEWTEDSPHMLITLPLLLARLCVFLSRLVIIAMSAAAGLCACFLLRQMEYDADAHEARLCGTPEWITTNRRILELTYATNSAFSQAHEQWQSRKLPDDLPTLIAAASHRLSGSGADLVQRQLTEVSTGLFDSHPAPRARARAVEKLGEPGVFFPEGPATALFRDVRAMNIRVTFSKYKELIGERVFEGTFVPVAAKEADRAGEVQTGLSAYLGFDPPDWRPLFLEVESINPASDAKRSYQTLRSARAAMHELGARSDHAKAFTEHDRQLSRCRQAAFLVEWGAKKLHPHLGVARASPDGVARVRDSANEGMVQAAGHIDEAYEHGVVRLTSALRLLASPEVGGKLPEGAARLARARELVAALHGMKRVLPAVRGVREEVDQFEGLSMFDVKVDVTLMKRRVREVAQRLQSHLEDVRREGGMAPYPFAHKDSEHVSVSIGQRLTGSGRFQTEPEMIVTAGHDLLERFPDDHRRVVAELVETAVWVERALDRAAAKRAGA